MERRPGLEPGSSAWKAEAQTSIPPPLGCRSFLAVSAAFVVVWRSARPSRPWLLTTFVRIQRRLRHNASPPARIYDWPRSQDCTSRGPLCMGGADTKPDAEAEREPMGLIAAPAFNPGTAHRQSPSPSCATAASTVSFPPCREGRVLRRLAKLSPWQESNLQMPGIPGASTISPHDEPPQQSLHITLYHWCKYHRIPIALRNALAKPYPMPRMNANRPCSR